MTHILLRAQNPYNQRSTYTKRQEPNLARKKKCNHMRMNALLMH